MNSRIEINPAVCHGKPVIRGTRVLVCNILGALSADQSVEEILEDYPNVTREDVLAVLDFAGHLSRFAGTPPMGKAFLLRDRTWVAYPQVSE